MLSVTFLNVIGLITPVFIFRRHHLANSWRRAKGRENRRITHRVYRFHESDVGQQSFFMEMGRIMASLGITKTFSCLPMKRVTTLERPSSIPHLSIFGTVPLPSCLRVHWRFAVSSRLLCNCQLKWDIRSHLHKC